MKKQNKLLEKLKKAGYFLIHRKGGRYTLIGGILAVCLIVTMSGMHFETRKQAENKSSYVVETGESSEQKSSKQSKAESGGFKSGDSKSGDESDKSSSESKKGASEYPKNKKSDSDAKSSQDSDKEDSKKSSSKEESKTTLSSGNSKTGSSGTSGGTSGSSGSSGSAGGGSGSGGSGSSAATPAAITVHLSIQINNVSGSNVNRLTNEDDRARASSIANGTVCSITLSMCSDQTVYDALVTATEAQGIPMGSRNTSYGTYVYMIDDFAEKEAGPSSGWMYAVNGKTPNVGAAAYHLTNGAQIVWFYVT